MKVSKNTVNAFRVSPPWGQLASSFASSIGMSTSQAAIVNVRAAYQIVNLFVSLPNMNSPAISKLQGMSVVKRM